MNVVQSGGLTGLAARPLQAKNTPLDWLAVISRAIAEFARQQAGPAGILPVRFVPFPDRAR
jgi:hypothetical protein